MASHARMGHKAQGSERLLDIRRESLSLPFSEACVYSEGTIGKPKANALGRFSQGRFPWREMPGLPATAVKVTGPVKGYGFRPWDLAIQGFQTRLRYPEQVPQT